MIQALQTERFHLTSSLLSSAIEEWETTVLTDDNLAPKHCFYYVFPAEKSRSCPVSLREAPKSGSVQDDCTAANSGFSSNTLSKDFPRPLRTVAKKKSLDNRRDFLLLDSINEKSV